MVSNSDLIRHTLASSELHCGQVEVMMPPMLVTGRHLVDGDCLVQGLFLNLGVDMYDSSRAHLAAREPRLVLLHYSEALGGLGRVSPA